MARRKETEFDKLASLIKSESEDIREHMATKEELAKLSTKVGGLETKVGGLETKVNGLEITVGRLEGKVDKVDSKLSVFENHEVDKRKQLEVRVTRLEKNIGV